MKAWRRTIALTGGLLLLAAAGWRWSLGGGAQPGTGPRGATAAAASQERFGIEVVSARLVARGYMTDVRVRVVDPEKAAPLFDRRVPPVLVAEETGAEFQVPTPPTVGSLRQAPKFPAAERTYFLVFANPGRHLQPGAKVKVRWGDHEVGGVFVQ